jgi:hypothetical protein
MLKYTSPVLRSCLVAAAAALLPLTATGDGGGGGVRVPTTAGAAPLRYCSLPAGTGTVQIVAGPANTIAGDITQATNFPDYVVDSTYCAFAPGHACLKWEYKWIYPAAGSSYPFVTLDSDLVLHNAVGGSSTPRVNAPGGDDGLDIGERVAEVRVVRFASNAQTVNASLYTATNASVGKVTAGFQSGNKKGYCGIQGAENQFGDPLLSQPQSITSTLGPCTIIWSLSPDGCVTAAATTPSTCTVTNRDLVVNGQTATTASCGTEVAGPFGSTESCKWSSILRRTICVTVP